MTETMETSQVQQRPHEVTVDSKSLAGNIFNIEMPKEETQTITTTQAEEKPKEEQAQTTTTAETPKAETVVNEWYKNFGYDNEDVAKTEIVELKKLKDVKPEEIKFENEQSRTVHELLRQGKVKEVMKIYDMQERLDTYLSTEVNKDNAADIIKLSMKVKHPDLTQSEIDYKYNKQFAFPKEPVQGADELDDDFRIRQSVWNEQVADIEINRLIEAKLAKPELEKKRTKLVLPEIEKRVSDTPKELTQEELDARTRYNEAFSQSVDLISKDFNGYSVNVKQDDLDFAISYGIPEEEKSLLVKQMKAFSEVNYDANALFAQRWVNEDKSINTAQMMKDLSVLNNYEKAFQKFSSDAAAKALEAYIKGKKNVSVTPTPTVTTEIKDDKTQLDNIRDQFFG